MTRFTGPVKVKKAFSETTVARIDASGSAHFAQGADFNGGSIFNGALTAGSDSGTQGKVQLVQQADLGKTSTANATVAVVPDGSDILDIYFFVDTAFATAAADVKVRVGTSANETLFGEFNLDTNIAGGMHHLANGAFTSAGSSWNNLSGAGAKIMAQVTAVSGAVASAASGKLSIVYVQ